MLASPSPRARAAGCNTLNMNVAGRNGHASGRALEQHTAATAPRAAATVQRFGGAEVAHRRRRAQVWQGGGEARVRAGRGEQRPPSRGRKRAEVQWLRTGAAHPAHAAVEIGVAACAGRKVRGADRTQAQAREARREIAPLRRRGAKDRVLRTARIAMQGPAAMRGLPPRELLTERRPTYA